MLHQYVTNNITKKINRRLFKSLCNLTILRVKHIKVSDKFGDFNFAKSVSNAKIVKNLATSKNNTLYHSQEFSFYERLKLKPPG